MTTADVAEEIMRCYMVIVCVARLNYLARTKSDYDDHARSGTWETDQAGSGNRANC